MEVVGEVTIGILLVILNGLPCLVGPRGSLDIHSRIAVPNTFVNTHMWLLKWKYLSL